MKVSILIPARMAATRFPGKPLFKINGKPMIQWVYERAALAGADDIIVATDSEQIFACVQAFGGKARMTRADHENGTQRIAEVAKDLDAEVVINVQGDEPCIHPNAIEAVVHRLQEQPSLEMATLAEEIRDPEMIFNPNVVKLVMDAHNRALYFSRAPIPYRKHAGMSGPTWPHEAESSPTYLRHIGVYGYRTDFLLRYVSEPPCALEQIEGLEQLRALYMGASIGVSMTQHPSIGVDTPADVARAEEYLKQAE